MFKRIAMVIIAMALAAGAAAWAQDAELPAGPDDQGIGCVNGQGPQQRCQYREKLRRRAETMMIFFVADELALDAQKEDEFVDAMREHLKSKSELDEQEMEYKRQIAEQLRDEKADKEKLEKTLTELEDVRAKREAMDDKLKDNLKEILDVEQQAKFEMALPRAREEIMKMIQKAKNMKGNAAGQGNNQGANGTPGPKGPNGVKGKFSK